MDIKKPSSTEAKEGKIKILTIGLSQRVYTLSKL